MASKLIELRAQRDEALKRIRHMLEENKGSWKTKPELQKEFDSLEALTADLGDQIKREQMVLDAEAETALSSKAQEATARGARANADPTRDQQFQVFDAFLRRGLEAASEVATRLHATMSTTTTTEGGYTVPSLISSNLYDAMKAYGAMRACCQNIRTADGKPLSFPTSDGTSEVGELISQNTTATGADPVFGTVSLNVFKYSSKIVACPFELLQDTTIDMEAFIRNRLAQRLGRILNQHFTTGTGAGAQPDGVMPRATVGKTGTAGQTLTIIFDDIVDLIHAVDPAYRTTDVNFMTNDALLKVIRKLKDTANRPIWAPSFEAGITRGVGVASQGGYTDQATPVPFDQLLGYPLYVNNDVAAPGVSAVTLAFGDFDYYCIRDAMDVTMFRFTDSAYAKLGQIGFLAWCRSGGNLLDVKAVQTYKHSAT